MQLLALDADFQPVAYLPFFNLQWTRESYQIGNFSVQIAAADYQPTMASLYTPDRPSPGTLPKLEPTETVILSTHLLSEINHFVSRAVLLWDGQIVGDVSTADLDEQGLTVLDYVKEKYHYQPDRVSNALSQLSGEEDGLCGNL